MNKQVVSALSGVIGILIAVLVPFALIQGSDEPAQASYQEDITLTLPPITVTQPPVTLPPVTLPPVTLTNLVTLPPVTVRPPTVTVPPVTIRPPRITITDRVIIPRATQTVTDRQTVTRRPDGNSSQSNQTNTVTETVTETRQGPTDRVTVTTSPDVVTETDTETRTTTETVVDYVVVGGIVTLALAALGILAMFIGYVLGQRDAKKNEDDFLEGLLDMAKIRKRS